MTTLVWGDGLVELELSREPGSCPAIPPETERGLAALNQLARFSETTYGFDFSRARLLAQAFSSIQSALACRDARGAGEIEEHLRQSLHACAEARGLETFPEENLMLKRPTESPYVQAFRNAVSANRALESVREWLELAGRSLLLGNDLDGSQRLMQSAHEALRAGALTYEVDGAAVLLQRGA